MAAGNWIFYNSAREYLADGTIDLDTHTFKVALLTNSYTPSAAHTAYADLTNELSTANGYTATGQALTSVTWSHSGTTATFDSADPTWTASGGSIGPFRIAVIYDDTTSSPADALLCYCILDSADITITTCNTYTIQMNASGIFTLTGATS